MSLLENEIFYSDSHIRMRKYSIRSVITRAMHILSFTLSYSNWRPHLCSQRISGILRDFSDLPLLLAIILITERGGIEITMKEENRADDARQLRWKYNSKERLAILENSIKIKVWRTLVASCSSCFLFNWSARQFSLACTSPSTPPWIENKNRNENENIIVMNTESIEMKSTRRNYENRINGTDASFRYLIWIN